MATHVKEHDVVFAGLDFEAGALLVDVYLYFFKRRVAHWHEALFVALAGDHEKAVVEVDARQLEVAQLADAQAAAVEGFDYGAVAAAGGRLEVDGVDHVVDVVDAEHLGQVAAKARRVEQQGGIVVDDALGLEVFHGRFHP